MGFDLKGFSGRSVLDSACMVAFIAETYNTIGNNFEGV